MYSKGGVLLTLTGDVIIQWKEHNAKLLNPNKMSSTVEAGSVVSWLGLHIGRVP